MKAYTTACFILLIGLGSISLSGQDFKKDMKLINAQLKPLKKYSVDLHYRMYLDNQFVTPYQEKIIEIKKDGAKSLCKHPTGELLSDGDMSLYVDHRFRHMMILQQQNAKTDEYLEFTNFVEEHIDSMMPAYEKISFQQLDGDINEYQCKMAVGKYSRIDIRFNRKTAHITSVQFYYRDKIQNDKIDGKLHTMVMRIDYENFNTSPVFRAGSFSTSRFLTKKGKNIYVPGINYKDYKIYDNTNF
jgi:hypothetical protein